MSKPTIRFGTDGGRTASVDRRRLFLPFGTPASEGAAMRAQGWVTVAALEAGDTPEAQVCTHLWVADAPRAL